VDRITVGEILHAVEGPLEPVDCVKSRVCPIRENCTSRYTWSELYREINDCVDSITLGDLAEAYRTMDKMEYAI
jgi:DNA-binding IscR family transcriptional regulator